MNKSIYLNMVLLLLVCISCVNKNTPEVIVVDIVEEGIVTAEITEPPKPFDRCDLSSPAYYTIQFSQSTNEEYQEALVLGFTGTGEVGISEIAKVAIGGAIETRFSKLTSSGDERSEKLEIEIPAYTYQEYTVVWGETRRRGIVTYIEDGVMKEAEYSYRIGLELLSFTGKDLECAGQSSADSTAAPHTESPSATCNWEDDWQIQPDGKTYIWVGLPPNSDDCGKVGQSGKVLAHLLTGESITFIIGNYSG
jgi:hypothetical protein